MSVYMLFSYNSDTTVGIYFWHTMIHNLILEGLHQYLLVPEVAEVLDVTEYREADCGTLYQL